MWKSLARVDCRHHGHYVGATNRETVGEKEMGRAGKGGIDAGSSGWRCQPFYIDSKPVNAYCARHDNLYSPNWGLDPLPEWLIIFVFGAQLFLDWGM